MNKKQILQKLRNDEDYYGDFGNQFLSNSHVGKLLKDPLRAFEQSKPSPAFLIGGYFHTCILEPNKIDKYKVQPLSENKPLGTAGGLVKFKKIKNQYIIVTNCDNFYKINYLDLLKYHKKYKLEFPYKSIGKPLEII